MLVGDITRKILVFDILLPIFLLVTFGFIIVKTNYLCLGDTELRGFILPLFIANFFPAYRYIKNKITKKD